MSDIRKHSATSNIVRVLLKNSSTGVPLTGLAYNSAGLIISTICDVEASAAVYAQASSNIETISTLGTFAAPTASKCRFKEVDATNHPGIYEIQIADARFSVANAKRIIISWSGATNLLADSYEILLDPYVNVNRVQDTAQTAGDLAALINTLDDYVDTEVAAIKAKTDNLPASPANEATLTTIAGYIDTEVAAILAAVDTEVAAIKAKTDNLPASPANEATLTTIAGYIDTEVAAILAAVDTEVASIKAKTDNLPTDPADESLLEAAIADLKTYVDTEVAAILAAVDTEVAAIKAKTDNLPTDPADQSAVEAAITSATSGLATAITNIALIRKIKTNTVRDKAGSPGVYEVLDDDNTTPILEITISAADPYQAGTIL